MTKIKICGLRRKEDISYINELKPDFIGFVFAKSSRHVDDEEAADLKSLLSKEIKAVGVFVNDDIEHILKLVNEKTIDLIQLHGDEDLEYINSLKEKTDCPIIKAVRVQSSNQIMDALKLNVDYLLLDTYTKDMYGGSGKRFDTSLIPKNLDNYFLAGGINAGNIKAVLGNKDVYCVDVSSGVETDGVKDREKIKEIINIIRK